MLVPFKSILQNARPGNESFGFVVKKGRQDLVDKLNAGIDAVRAKGIEAELLKKWLGD